MIKNIQQYISVLDGAPLETLYEDELSENDLMAEENEALLKGEEIIALSTDDHPMHIRRHSALLNDPKVRLKNQRTKAIIDHISEHVALENNTDPMLKAMVRTGKAPEGGQMLPQQPQQQQELPPIPGEAGTQSAIPTQDLAMPAKDLMEKVRG